MPDRSSFLTLSPGAAPGRFVLPVGHDICVGPIEEHALFGGVGLAAGISALEQASGRPAIWATCQYLDFARPPALLDVDTTIVASGHYTTQGRARVRHELREVLTIAASLGLRPHASQRQWVTMPSVPPPTDCDPMPVWWDRTPPDLHGRLDLRVARGWHLEGDDDGRAALWARSRDNVRIDRPYLAVLGDFMPSALGYVMGGQKVSSLDNSVRFLQLVETEWVMCDIRIYGMADGFGHGRMVLFAEDGTALAIASQSVVIRDTGYTRVQA